MPISLTSRNDFDDTLTRAGGRDALIEGLRQHLDVSTRFPSWMRPGPTQRVEPVVAYLGYGNAIVLLESECEPAGAQRGKWAATEIPYRASAAELETCADVLVDAMRASVEPGR